MIRRSLCDLVAFLIFACLLGPYSASAQVSGTVFDAESGAPLAGATVRIAETDLAGITDRDGSFLIGSADLFADHPPELTVVVNFLGYNPVVRVVRIENGTGEIGFRLEPSTVSLGEVLIEQASMIGGLKGLARLPGSAHLVTARSLERFAATDAHRALRSVPGVTIQEEDGFGLRPNIGLRGSGSERSSRITLMEDGVLAAPAPYAAPAAYYFPTIGRMSGIEVVKGSSQVRYGPFTTGGAINFLSTPIPTERSVKATVHAGDHSSRLVHASLGNAWDRVAFLVETHQQATSGFKDLDSAGDTGFRKADYLAKVRFQSGDAVRLPQRLTLKASVTDEVSDETYLGLTSEDFLLTPLRRYAGSSIDEMDARQRQIVARHWMAPSDWLEVTTTAYSTRFKRNWYKLDGVRSDGQSVKIGALLDDPSAYPKAYAALVGERPEDLLSVKANNREYQSSGLQADGVVSVSGLRLDFGGRLHRDEMDRFQWSDDYSLSGSEMSLVSAGLPGTESNRIESANAASGYVQAELARGRLSFRPGIRVEHVIHKRLDFGKADPDRSGSALTSRRNTASAFLPGLGISFAPTTHWTAFVGVHRGFAPPGTTEGARPELSINYEAGLRQARGPVSFEAVAFVTDYSNLLGSDLAASGGLGTTDQFNGGAALVRGLELSGSYNLGALVGWWASIPLSASYTHSQGEFSSDFESSFDAWGSVSDGDELPYLARNQGSLTIALERARWDLAITTSWVGAMRTGAGTGAIPPDARIDAHRVIDVSAEVAVAPTVRAFASIRNVTDALYVAARRPAGLRPGLPRTAIAGLRLNL